MHRGFYRRPPNTAGYRRDLYHVDFVAPHTKIFPPRALRILPGLTGGNGLTLMGEVKTGRCLSRLRAATIAEPPNNLTEQTCSPWDAVKLQLVGTGHRHFPDTGWPTHHARKATAWQTTKSNAKLVTALAFNSSNNHPSPASEFIPHAAKFATARGDLRRQLIEAHRAKDRT